MRNDLIFIDGGELLPVEQGQTFAEGTNSHGEPWLDRRARFFRTGTHKGRLYTVEALEKMASTFSAPSAEDDWSVPLQLDHSESARDTVGHVREVKRADQLLLGTIRFTGAESVGKAKAGNYRKLSIGLRANGAIREVSVTPFPYLNDATTFAEEGTDVTEEEKKKAEEAKKAAEQATESEALRKMREDFDARTKADEARFAELERKNAEQAKTIRFAEITGRVNTFSEKGKTVPAMREKELAFLQTLSDDQLKLYCELKDVTPALVDLSVHGTQESTKPGVSADQQSFAEQAEKFAEKY